LNSCSKYGVIAKESKFFAKITSDQVRYDIVDNYAKLMELVK